MKAADRICCDGQCSEGRACPLTAHQRRPAAQQRLAPGVLAGPYRKPRAAWLRRAYQAVWAWLITPERL